MDDPFGPAPMKNEGESMGIIPMTPEEELEYQQWCKEREEIRYRKVCKKADEAFSERSDIPLIRSLPEMARLFRDAYVAGYYEREREYNECP